MLFESIDKTAKNIVFVYTTCGGKEEARSIGLSAIEQKLAISADYWPINSIYPWKYVIQEIDQYMVMFSTQKSLSDSLIKHIETEHSYSVPMVARCDTAVTNQPYHFWVDTTLSSKDKYLTEKEYYLKKKDEEQGYHYDRLK